MKPVAGVLETWGDSCQLCPRQCKVARGKGEKGYCRTPAEAWVSSALTHHGEEPCISGSRGSGTIFFSFCTGRCVFCQNYQISQCELGSPVTVEELAGMMLDLKRQGCHNINLVSPTPHLGNIVAALKMARGRGLDLPIVYNTSGYERPEVIRELGREVDIYLPDLKYADDQMARTYSDFERYWNYATSAIEEMVRQTGPVEMDASGLMRRGVLVRHLVLPGSVAGTESCLNWLARFSPHIGLGLMAQYHPCYHADRYPPLNRPLTRAEYEPLKSLACQREFFPLYLQELSSSDDYLPDFDRKRPFER